MEKVRNFRDLGGIPAGDGRKVVSGTFFRSGFLDEASEGDIEFLRGLGLKAIFDYRDEGEVPSEAVYEAIGVKHVHCPNNITRIEKMNRLKTGGVSRIFIRLTKEDIMRCYEYIPFGNAGYREMVKALTAGEVPFLQHCIAGKDRAGLGAALLLGILGVSYEEIMRDYLVSREMSGYITGVMLREVPPFLKKMVGRNLAPFFTVDKSYLDAAIAAVKRKYDTFENYLFAEYGLDAEKIAALRERYTIEDSRS